MMEDDVLLRIERERADKAEARLAYLISLYPAIPSNVTHRGFYPEGHEMSCGPDPKAVELFGLENLYFDVKGVWRIGGGKL